MFRLFTMLLCVVIIGVSSSSRADSPPITFQAALELWKQITPSPHTHIFDHVTFIPVRGDDAPLARYSPKTTREFGTIEIGQNIHRYRNEYVYLSSDQDMSAKPDFDQYMTVLMTLSLANESAHALQDHNGSLKDFYKFYNDHQLNNACALYSLQQHVSDIVMLKTGMGLEQFFLGKGSVKGINALRIVLEKNDLRDEFEEFRNAMNKKDSGDLNDILRHIRTKRNAANMSGLPFCPPYGDAILNRDIIDRATEPAGYPFQQTPHVIDKIKSIFNN